MIAPTQWNKSRLCDLQDSQLCPQSLKCPRGCHPTGCWNKKDTIRSKNYSPNATPRRAMALAGPAPEKRREKLTCVWFHMEVVTTMLSIYNLQINRKEKSIHDHPCLSQGRWPSRAVKLHLFHSLCFNQIWMEVCERALPFIGLMLWVWVAKTFGWFICTDLVTVMYVLSRRSLSEAS